MGHQPYWNAWSDRELLKIRLCDLDLSLNQTFVDFCIDQLKLELKSRGFIFCPHFWISSEWFCADGIPGVAIPFYLLHPRLIALEKKYIGEAEGETSSSCMKLLRHETGHALENAYRLRSHSLRKKIFGNSAAIQYPASYRPRLFSKDYVIHLEGGYAQGHPDEDFAETFAVWLAHSESWWRQNYRGWRALTKLKAMSKIVLDIKSKKPMLSNRLRVDPLENLKMTLGEYFKKKKIRLKVRRFKRVDRQLLEIFEVSNKQKKRQKKMAHYFLKSKGEELIVSISTNTGLFRYQVEPHLKTWVKRSRAKSLVLKNGEHYTLKAVLDLLTGEVLEDLYRGRDKIML